MKLIFKCIILLSISLKTYALDGIIISHNNKQVEVDLLIKVLTSNFHFPKELIKIQKDRETCEIQKESVLQFCINNEGEFEIKNMNYFYIKNNFQRFIKVN